jgi:hypothetical protein
MRGSALVGALLLCFICPCWSQNAATPQNYPSRLPYRFSNFVWWSDSDLRNLLKNRIPTLGDEIAPASATESKIRDTLTGLLKEKQIVAEVQSQEPSTLQLTGERAPGAPEPAIVFSIASPQILVDKVLVPDDATGLADPIHEALQPREGKGYSSGANWSARATAEEQLEAHGYLEATVAVTHDPPRQEGDRYLVNLLVSITPGRQYRISSISAGGGPLLVSRDLSPSFSSKAGDIAGSGAFGSVPAQLRAYYWRYGYADVQTVVSKDLDRKNGTAALRLDVHPGPLYRVRTLTIDNLNAEQESKARALLGLKPGDVFDQLAINNLYHKIPTDPLLAGYGFTFSPKEDKSAATVDLTLNFYKKGQGSSVTFR